VFAGYKILRFYWSMRHVNKRCSYYCSIAEVTFLTVFLVCIADYDISFPICIFYADPVPRFCMKDFRFHICKLRRFGIYSNYRNCSQIQDVYLFVITFQY
jgi:hypothetical protein